MIHSIIWLYRLDMVGPVKGGAPLNFYIKEVTISFM